MVYLAFFLPMAASRIVLVKTGIITDVGTISLIVTICGVAGAIALWWGARNTACASCSIAPPHSG